MHVIESGKKVFRRCGRGRWGLWLWLAACPLAAVAADNPPAQPASPSGEVIPKNPVLQDSFRFNVGGFYASTNTVARLDAGGGTGADVNFEDALGMDDRKLVGEGAMYWRFTEHWRLDVNYFAITRRATRTISQDIQWGGQTFTAGTEVHSGLRLSDMRASVGYSIFRRSDKEVGVGLGLHATGLRAWAEASGIGGQAGDITAPLPVVDFYGNFALTNTWALTTRLDWLSLGYENYSGQIRSLALDVIYQPFRNVGFGFGWHSLITKLTVDNTDWRGQVALAYQGPSAYVSFSF